MDTMNKAIVTIDEKGLADELTKKVIVRINKEALIKNVKSEVKKSLDKMFAMKPFRLRKYQVNVVIVEEEENG